MPQIKLTTSQFFSYLYYWKWDYPSILKADLQAIILVQIIMRRPLSSMSMYLPCLANLVCEKAFESLVVIKSQLKNFYQFFFAIFPYFWAFHAFNNFPTLVAFCDKTCFCQVVCFFHICATLAYIPCRYFIIDGGWGVEGQIMLLN